MELDYDTRRKSDSERRRLAVLTAAGECFGEHGYKQCNVEQIARRAGVSKGLVFHFFKSKQQLFQTVIEDSLNQWATLSEYRASGGEGSSLEELRRLFLASFDFVIQHPVFDLFTRPEEQMMAAYRDQIERRNRRWRSRVQRTIKAGIRTGELRKLPPERVAAIFHELQTSLINNALVRRPQRHYDAKTVNLAIDILLEGIRV